MNYTEITVRLKVIQNKVDELNKQGLLKKKSSAEKFKLGLQQFKDIFQ